MSSDRDPVPTATKLRLCDIERWALSVSGLALLYEARNTKLRSEAYSNPFALCKFAEPLDTSVFYIIPPACDRGSLCTDPSEQEPHYDCKDSKAKAQAKEARRRAIGHYFSTEAYSLFAAKHASLMAANLINKSSRSSDTGGGNQA